MDDMLDIYLVKLCREPSQVTYWIIWQAETSAGTSKVGHSTEVSYCNMLKSLQNMMVFSSKCYCVEMKLYEIKDCRPCLQKA